MEDDFGIPMEPVMEREVNNMGSFSDAFFERGVEQGIAKGEVEATSKAIQALANNTNISFAEAMSLLSIPEADQQKYLDILKPQCV